MQVDISLAKSYGFQKLQSHANQIKRGASLRALINSKTLQAAERSEGLCVDWEGIFLDLSHQHLSTRTLDFLFGKISFLFTHSHCIYLTYIYIYI